MNITVAVDQKESIKRGCNANSTVKLDVDVATLTPRQREVIASRFEDGTLRYVTIPQPDITGLLEWANDAVARADEEAAQKAASEAKLEAEIQAYRARFSANPDGCIMLFGSHVRGAGLKDAPYTGASHPHDHAKRVLTPEQFQKFLVIGRAMEQRERDEAARKQAESEAKKAERAARLEAQIQEFASARGGTLAARYAAGYSSTEEMVELIRRHALDAAGLDSNEYMSCSLWEKPLTDEQFERLQGFLARVPQPHTDPDIMEHRAGDDSGTLIALASWKVGEVTVTASEIIGELPDGDVDDE